MTVAPSNLSANGNAGPTMVSYGNQQVAAYVDGSNNVWMAIHTRGEDDWETYNLSLTGLSVSPLEQGDQHETPSLGICDGYIWLSANNYQSNNSSDDSKPRIIRSAGRMDITSWVDALDALSSPWNNVNSYFKFAHLPNGKLMLIYRSRHAVENENNPGYEFVEVIAPGESSWTSKGALFAAPYDQADSEDALYRNQPIVFPDGRVGVFGAVDTDYDTLDVINHAYFETSDEGDSWHNILGETYEHPFNRSNMTPFLTGIDYGSDSNLYAHGAAYDANGYPCAVFSSAKSGHPQQGQHIIRWNGSAWVDEASFRLTYGGGQAMNIINFRNDLWIAARHAATSRIRLHRVGSPNEVIVISGNVPGGWFAFPDPIALRDHGVLEFFVPDGTTPRIYTGPIRAGIKGTA